MIQTSSYGVSDMNFIEINNQQWDMILWQSLNNVYHIFKLRIKDVLEKRM